MAKIIVAVFGTAGDVLPCVAVARKLRDRGDDVGFLTPRWAGFYPRQAGFRTITVGDGGEKRALLDRCLYTNRFGGMDSWRRSMTSYVLPLLSEYYLHCRDLIHQFGPDLIVTTAQSFWGSLAAAELNIPWVSYLLYPQLYELRIRYSRGCRHFASPLTQWLVSQEKRIGVPNTECPIVDWAVSPHCTVGGHDPAVYQSLNPKIMSLGFAYTDDAFDSTSTLDEALTFLEGNQSGNVVVSMGSFIGLVATEVWDTMSAVAAHSERRFLFVGVARRERERLSGENVLALSHVPLSRILPHADLVIHHGGIGSTYASLNSATPSLVLPHAFDQAVNGRLVEDLGVGSKIVLGAREIGEAIETAMCCSAMASKTRSLAARLIPPEKASDAIAAYLVKEL